MAAAVVGACVVEAVVGVCVVEAVVGACVVMVLAFVVACIVEAFVVATVVRASARVAMSLRTRRMETALPFHLRVVHGVSKWLHHPVL